MSSLARARFALIVRQLSFIGIALVTAACFFQFVDGSWRPALQAVAAPFWFGVRNVRFGDPAGALAVAVCCSSVVALFASWARPNSWLGFTWGWLILLHLVTGNVLMVTGARAGTGLRLSVPYTGPFEPIPAAAPCSSCVLHGFATGTVETWSWTMVDGGRGRLSLPAMAWLFVHPTHGMVLIDVGLSPAIATDAAAHVGPLLWHSGAQHLVQAPGADLRATLLRTGFDPEAVRTIVLTHLHPDHAGAVEQFPAARVIVGEPEAAALDAPVFPLIASELDGPIDFQAAPLVDRRIGPWAQSADLFGDGTVRLISTPGHSPGHLSVLLSLASGQVLLAGDSAPTELNLRTGSVALRVPQLDHVGWREALGQLERFQREAPQVLLVPGHDPGPVRRARRPDIQIHD